jgi:hypothetical protein
MKKILLIVLPLLLIVGCSKPINDESLIDKDGLKYHPDSKELYSGKVFTNYIGGMTKMEGSYLEGKKDGLFTQWYNNGQKKSEINFKNGSVGLEYLFSIKGDTLCNNDNKSMEYLTNDYKSYLNGKWLVDQNNSNIPYEIDNSDSLYLVVEFNELELLMSENNKQVERFEIDYDKLLIGNNGDFEVSLSVNILNCSYIDLILKSSERKNPDEIRLRLSNIH